MAITRKSRIDAGIDMTPLIDVVFQLLIFLMVSSQFIKPDRQVELPAGPLDSVPASDNKEHLTLVITDENTLLFEGEETTEEELGLTIKTTIASTGIDSLVIRSDKKADVGTFIPTLEIARKSGIINLAYDKRDASAE